MTESKTEGWHLDKRVQLSVIITILMQTAVIVWWASRTDSRVADHERRMIVQERSTEQRAQRDLLQEGRLARIEEGVRSLLDTAPRLERRIDGDRGRP